MSGEAHFGQQLLFFCHLPLLAMWRKLLPVFLVNTEAGFLLGTGSLVASCSQSLNIRAFKENASGSFLLFKLSLA